MRIEARYLASLLLACFVGVALVLASLFRIPDPAPGVGDLRLVEAAAKPDKNAVRSLLREGLAVNASQPDGATALHWAAHWDDLETADLLLRARANVNAKNDYGATPLWLACTNGNAAMVERLLAAGANPNITTPSGETALMRCARTGSDAAVKSLLNRKAEVNVTESEQGQTALMWAVAQKHPAAAQALIAGGADIHAHSKGGFTPLLFAARVGDAESAGILLGAGADVNEKGPNGMTPLLLASAGGQEAMGIFLLEKGADPNAKDENGATALHYAVLKGITSLNGVRYANYVAHLFRPSQEGLVKALLAHKADPNVQLVKAPRLGGVSPPTAIGATPFLLAAASPDARVMRLLADAGADPKLATKGNITPLMAAAGLSRGQYFTDEDKAVASEAVRIAVELGADVNAANEDGQTALLGAAGNGANEVVQFLAQKGAKLDVRDKYQQTPLSIATGIRLPWIPYGEELGEIIQPSTAELLLKLGATPVNTPGYNRLSRFSVPDGSKVADRHSEQVLINQFDHNLWHDGSGMFFGQDGFLYLGVSDEGDQYDTFQNSQTIRGKIFSGVLRIDVDQNAQRSHPIRRQPQPEEKLPEGFTENNYTANYFVPNDNPFLDPKGGVLEEFWAVGLRNPHRMTQDSATGRIWVGDIGQDKWEEVDIIERGGNYQWVYMEGTHPSVYNGVQKMKPAPADFIGVEKPPLYEYGHGTEGKCVIGGYVYRGQRLAAELGAKYIFGDNGSGRLWALAWDGKGAPTVEYLCNMPPGSNYTGLSSFGVDASGELLICKMGRPSKIYKLERADEKARTKTITFAAPERISWSGAFSDLATLTPIPGFIAYDVNSPLWSDGAQKRRWVAVPKGEQIKFAPAGQWQFPDGTVFIKHFDLTTNVGEKS
jgi:ankyrin repeat protein